MARTSEQGLLAKMGFQDKDRSDPLHTLACQYVMRPDVAEKIVRAVTPQIRSDSAALIPSEAVAFDSIPAEDRRRATWQGWVQHAYLTGVESVSAVPEVAVRSRSGFLIGFWDVVLSAVFNELCVGQFAGRTLFLNHPRPTGNGLVDIEVKTTPCDIAEVARQLETLHTPMSTPVPTVLVTTFPISPEDKAFLGAKGFHHVRLGEPFQKYVAERRARPLEDDGAGL